MMCVCVFWCFNSGEWICRFVIDRDYKNQSVRSYNNNNNSYAKNSYYAKTVAIRL